MHKKNTPSRVNAKTIASGDWLRLEKIEYLDHTGRKRTWETSSRQRDGGAVFIIARMVPSGRFILVKQYRPPIDAYVLEFPAGLVDPQEEPETAAVRELREETGYVGTITWIGPRALSSPGMTREGVFLAVMEVDETLPANQNPRQQCEESEEIEVILKTLADMPELLRLSQEQGLHADSRLIAYFLGLGMRW